jgi:sortase (surface protein transpeptidase)
VGLSLPALEVSAPVLPVGTTGGTLQIPADPDEIGWWRGSVAAGSASGSTVLAGHVDTAEQGPGALYRLTDLNAGDPVTVTLADGREVPYRVEARRTYVKGEGLPEALFHTDGPAQLVLITCGGPFDERTLSYEDNVVVLAVPAAAP